MNWLTGWILRGERRQRRARRPPTVSSPTLRSLRMTSGLFNTGVPGDSTEITSHASTVQPNQASFKDTGNDFSAEDFCPDFDMNMFGDLDTGLVDPLGDASLDSFTDLSALLSENTFMDPALEDKEVSLDFLDFDTEVKPDIRPAKRSFEEMADVSSDLDKLSANVGLVQTSSHDHDYSTKRPRMSTPTAEVSVEKVEIFLPPAPSPTPSTSYAITGSVDKQRNRREKNNVASKRSREIRKQKFVSMESEAERLIVDNARLEKRIVELEKLAKQMKEILVAKMAGK